MGHFLLDEYPFLLMHLINVLAKHSKQKLMNHDHDSIDDDSALSNQMLLDREDWYFHHFSLLICGIEIENKYDLKDKCVKDLIAAMIIFLENAPKHFEHLNECIYLTSLLLLKISKHYFHFFPTSEKLQKLQEKFKETKMEKLYSVMQS